MTASFAAALSEHPDPASAVGEVLGAVSERAGVQPDLAVLFVTGHHLAAIDDLVDAVRTLLRPACLIGTTAVSVAAGPIEVEERPAVSLWTGNLGDCEAVRLETLNTSDGAAVVGMPEAAADGSRTLVLLADPYSFPTDALAEAVTSQYPDLALVGGLASGGGRGQNRMIVDGEIHDDGAVGALLPAGSAARTVVSQGCRPIGEPMIITESEGNVLRSLAGRPPLEHVDELVRAADEHERELIGRGLHIGLVIDESKLEFERGDFLIRGVLGGDRGSGSMVVGDVVPVGATVQFHVRDAMTADEDLRAMLAGHRADAALLFTCNGRGRHLFEVDNHDAELVDAVVDGGAVAGMFCAGELGPVAGRNHVHGFTASMVFF